jgi:predicted dehydrogenase
MRVVIVGAGVMGYWHGREARRQGAHILGVVDPDEQRAARLARTLRAPRIAKNATELFQPGHIDAVHVCSPLDTHGALTALAINCGIHALVEKPLTESAQEAARLLGSAREHGVVLCPVHQIAFQDGVLDAAGALKGLGRLAAIDFRICSAGGAGRPERELDAIVTEILPHPLSVLRKLWPKAPLEPQLWGLNRAREGELLISGQHANALLSVLISMHGRPPCFEMTIRGEQGTVRVDFFHGFATVHHGGASRARKLLRPFYDAGKSLSAASINLLRRGARGETAYPGLRRLIGSFYAAARGEAPSPIDPGDIMAVATAGDTMLVRLLSRPENVR